MKENKTNTLRTQALAEARGNCRQYGCWDSMQATGWTASNGLHGWDNSGVAAACQE
eukprot:COSAG04_NODE_17679_length_462_cov_0.842975_1_plen_55_part_10